MKAPDASSSDGLEPVERIKVKGAGVLADAELQSDPGLHRQDPAWNRVVETSVLAASSTNATSNSRTLICVDRSIGLTSSWWPPNPPNAWLVNPWARWQLPRR